MSNRTARLSNSAIALLVIVVAAVASAAPRTDWGRPDVHVAQTGDLWTIQGQKHAVTLRRSDLTIAVNTPGCTWTLRRSQPGELVVRTATGDVSFALSDAAEIKVSPFDSGASAGIRAVLNGWSVAGRTVDMPISLSISLEGQSEEVVFSVAGAESDAAFMRQLDWPQALDGHVDFTVLNHYRGILLPGNWPEAYNPIRSDRKYPDDRSEIQSDVVECWSQPWWGFQRGASALMVIIETPDDAAYQWQHPAGGPTTIGPRWRAQLGRLRTMRTARLVAFDRGNYVDLAKRYRQHAIDTGLWVPLAEKIAREPKVRGLIGGVESRVGVLRNIVPESRLFNREKPELNHSLTTFAERARQLRELKAKGIERFNLVLTGWGRLGYDREHPEVLPPAPEGGGYQGMKELADTCRELGYLFSLHDQYRDYYVEAPSYSAEFAVHEETEGGAATSFPGTRFGSWKEGALPFLAAWDGGKQTYLNARYFLPHVRKNYGGLFEHGIRPDGSYFDVFGYVPPDQDFNPRHPTTRTEAKRAMAATMQWARANLGVVGTEAGCDWTVPFVDYTSPLGPGKAGIPIPLFNLVYHDAVMVQYSPALAGGESRMNRDDRPNWLYGMLNGGMPRADLGSLDRSRAAIDAMTALHRRVALLELTKHEFLDADFRRERSTFADGTTVVVDWNQKTAVVSPSP